MTMLVWNPEWETGIAKIDQQHRNLLDQIEILMAAIHANEAEDRLPSLLQFLSVYVDQHFREEEIEMEASKYPRFAAHHAIHNFMRQQVATLLSRFQDDRSVVTDEVLDFMTDWLVKHINEEDRLMARHLLRFAAEHHQAQP